MKKIIVIFIVFSTLLLSACGNQLDEKAGVFGNFDLTPADPSDVHYFIYDFATNHDPYSIYPNSEYHYYYCADSLYGGGCTLEAGFEPHTKNFRLFQVSLLCFTMGITTTWQSLSAWFAEVLRQGLSMCYALIIQRHAPGNVPMSLITAR